VDNTFQEDLARGIKIEELLASKLREKYPCTTIVHAYKGYDIWVPEINKSIEVKYDPMSNKTGNIVVEIEYNGKPSALMTTTADYWVFYDDSIFVMLTPKQIIACIFACKLSYVEFTGNGDNKPKKAFLISKEILFNSGKPFK